MSKTTTSKTKKTGRVIPGALTVKQADRVLSDSEHKLRSREIGIGEHLDTVGEVALRTGTAMRAPRIGERFTVRGIACRIVRIYPFGTLDCVSLDGERAYRVTGLGF